MPVSLYALFRRAANASYKPDGAPLADRHGEIAAVRRAFRSVREYRWSDAAFTLSVEEERVYGAHAGAVDARTALADLRDLARACNHVWGMPGLSHPSIPALAAVVREDVTAAYPLADALEERGLTAWREQVDVVITAYQKHFPRGK